MFMYHASQKNRKITSLRKKAEIKIQINDNYAVFVGWFVFFSLCLSVECHFMQNITRVLNHEKRAIKNIAKLHTYCKCMQFTIAQ